MVVLSIKISSQDRLGLKINQVHSVKYDKLFASYGVTVYYSRFTTIFELSINYPIRSV